ncbi:MAG: Holliday junction resolvase RuvX [Fusobacteriaceae bacterium]|jgi:putative Holliday junction resolvase|nr:Holliday junction resolvase RuvX [Fusobacteriaceae bacterium]
MLKKYISLDVGDVRIGVAKSDVTGIIATPLEVIDRQKTKAIKRIIEICEIENTKSIVIGIPKSLDGSEKRQAEKVREFIKKIKDNIPFVEIIEIDERFTTISADRILNTMNKKGAIEKRKVVDKVAAAIILQNFLDSFKKKN